MAEQTIELQVLRELAMVNMPIGASYLTLRIEASQATIGRVLQELEFRGMVEKASNKGRMLTKAGRQYYEQLQKNLDSGQQATQLVGVITSGEKADLLDVLETRFLLEQHTVRLATKIATQEQLNHLANILERQAEKQGKGSIGEEENLEFHTAVAAMAGNKVIEILLDVIMTQYEAYRNFSALLFKVAESFANDHLRILKAMQMGDADLACELMKSHLQSLIDGVKKISPDFEKRGDD